MNFFSEERSGELRDLFFEGAEELLQALNDAGLQLEENSGDTEVIRRVRRAVHTLKGDSAACGYHHLSELAHELEDVLTPQVAEKRGKALAEVVLTAADTFQAMLAAYRRNLQPPVGEELRAHIRKLLGESETVARAAGHGGDVGGEFGWSEYEQLMIAEALHRGEAVYNIALRIDPASQMRAAALQLVRNVLHSAGTVLALRPEDNMAAEHIDVIEAAVASQRSEEWIRNKCRIPTIVADLRVERAAVENTLEHEMLGAFLDSEAAAVAAGLKNAPEPAAKLPGGTSAALAAVAESTLRVDAARIDAVMNLVGELIIGKSMLHRTILEFDQKFARDPLRGKFADALAFQSRVLDDLQKSVMKIRMVPVEQLFRRFPRIVRDVAKLCGKDVALEVAGQNTDLDKGILDALAEPLTHLVRNAVDHGIEAPEVRLASGKPARGTISLNAFHQGAQVVIELRDDGRGIDWRKVLAHAIDHGLATEEEAARMTEPEALNLVFQPGFSTAEEVTEISGRGVGLDVVSSVLQRLKGSVEITTQAGGGTTFQLLVPLTLASIQALLFRVGGRLYAVPLSSVLEITRTTEDDIHRVDQREVLQLREQILTLVRLNRLSKIHAVAGRKRSFVIVIGTGERKFGLLVDSLVGEEELVIKSLGNELVSSDLVSGASILGDGTVVLILNVPAVVARLSKAPALEATA